MGSYYKIKTKFSFSLRKSMCLSIFVIKVSFCRFLCWVKNLIVMSTIKTLPLILKFLTNLHRDKVSYVNRGRKSYSYHLSVLCTKQSKTLGSLEKERKSGQQKQLGFTQKHCKNHNNINSALETKSAHLCRNLT